MREPKGEDESGTPIFDSRPASEADLIKLGSMRLSEMDEAAQKMFGPSAARAVNHIQNLRKLATTRNKAIAEAEKKAGEWKTQQSTEMANHSQTLAKTWQEINKNLEERLPKAFNPDEGDDTDRDAHTKGFALADLLFLGEPGLTPEQVEALPATFRDTIKAKQPLTEQQRVTLHALARIKVANHDRLMVKFKKAQDRISELEKTISEFEKSEPSSEKAGSSSEKTSSKDWLQEAEDELRALDK